MSKKTVVVYKTVYGSTEQYAQWLAKELDADLMLTKNARVNKLLEYDRILFGGGLYAAGICGIKKLTKNFAKLANKEIVVFSVGLAAPSDKVIEDIKKRNFTPQMQDKIKFFALRGAFDYDKLGFIHKRMMDMLKKMLKKKDNVLTDEDTQDMLKAYDAPVSFVDRNNIKPILNVLKGE